RSRVHCCPLFVSGSHASMVADAEQVRNLKVTNLPDIQLYCELLREEPRVSEGCQQVVEVSHQIGKRSSSAVRHSRSGSDRTFGKLAHQQERLGTPRRTSRACNKRNRLWISHRSSP